MSGKKLGLIIIYAILIIFIFLFILKTGFNFEKLKEIVEQYKNFAPMVFIVVYSISTILLIPITPLSILSGIMFGPIWGTVYALTGANIGASFSFLISRYLLKSSFEGISNAQILFLRDKIKTNGWKFISISRLMPFFPFNVQNYIFGITDVSLKTFVCASIIGLIPGTTCYTYLGFLGENAISKKSIMTNQIIIVISVILIISFLPLISKKIGKLTSKEI